MRALTAPIGLAVTDASGSAGDRISEDYVAWATGAVARYEVLKTALEAAGAQRAVHDLVVEDQTAPASSLSLLVKGLDVLKTKLGVRGVQ